MRINKFIAQATPHSRRAADALVAQGRVTINGIVAQAGSIVSDTDTVELDHTPVAVHARTVIVMLNKPAGYVVSRNGQGNPTIYDLLPPSLHALNPIGRLDKDSSGLLLLTNDGQLAQELTHPSFHKRKQYTVCLDAALQPLHRQMISDFGVMLQDGRSMLQLERASEGNDKVWIVTMHEGRNRQIRRTFHALGYTVTDLHRTHFGEYLLGDLPVGKHREIPT